MKANFLKKVLVLVPVSLILLVTTAFITKEKAITVNDKLDYYFFMEANIDDGNYNYKTRHISSIIYYEGYETCGKDYDFEAKARKSFDTYLRAEYSCKRMRVSVYNGNDKRKTRQEAQEKMNGYVAEEKDNGHQVVKTNFSYSCE